MGLDPSSAPGEAELLVALALVLLVVASLVMFVLAHLALLAVAAAVFAVVMGGYIALTR